MEQSKDALISNRTTMKPVEVEEEESQCNVFCKKALCRESLKDRCENGLKAIFMRKPSALKPLDGMRAIAIIWVFFVHTLANNPVYAPCFTTNGLLIGFMGWMAAGDLGVDIFFVLSGFLIAYILMREYTKYGSIDIPNFYRGRFIRIWPVIFLYGLVELPFKSL